MRSFIDCIFCVVRMISMSKEVVFSPAFYDVRDDGRSMLAASATCTARAIAADGSQ